MSTITETNFKDLPVGTEFKVAGDADRWFVCERQPNTNHDDFDADDPGVVFAYFYSSEADINPTHKWYDVVGPDDIEAVVALPTQETVAAAPEREHSPQERLNHALLYVAVEQQRGVTFPYAKGKEQAHIENRRLNPEAILKTKDGVEVVLGTDPDREEVRTYRIDRIKGTVTVL